jgi:hypothetical protein
MITYEELERRWDSKTEEKLDRWQKKLNKTKTTIESTKKFFHGWNPLRIYTSTTSGSKYSLRFHGQEVGELRVKSDTVTLYVSKEKAEKNLKTFDYTLGTIDSPWRSKEAKEFRAFFIKRNTSNVRTRIGEHQVQDYILEGLNGKHKAPFFKNRIAVTLGNVPLQFPVPFSASNGKIRNSRGYIDILGRAKNGAHISIWEIKQKGKSKGIVEQAYSYALQILLMLRSKNQGEGWIELFGMHKSRLKRKLLIEIVLAVHKEDKVDLEVQINKASLEIYIKKKMDSILITRAYYSGDQKIRDIEFKSTKN